jgi:purine-binding chemotaxis protein CheW
MLSLTDSQSQMKHWNLVAFRLSEQVYALPIESVVQIIEMVMITPVPLAAPSLQGVINVRGATVPVVNLRCHLGLPRTDLRPDTPIILARIDGRSIGLIVDEVIDVLSIPSEQWARQVDILPQGLDETPGLSGLAQTAYGMVLALDPDRLFSLDRAAVLARVVDALPGSPPAECPPRPA